MKEQNIQSLDLSEVDFDMLATGKLATIRFGKRVISLGPLLFISAEKQRAKIVEVWMTYYCSLREVSTDHLEMNKYRNHDQALLGLSQFYPNISLDSMVTTICFLTEGDRIRYMKSSAYADDFIHYILN